MSNTRMDQVTGWIERKLKTLGYCIVQQFIRQFGQPHLGIVIQAIIQGHKQQWSSQYELLCCVVVRTDNLMAIEYETYENIFRGIISRSNAHNQLYFGKKDIKELTIIAIYDKSIPYRQIKQAATSQSIPKSHKYINRFAKVRAIEKDETVSKQVALRQSLPKLPYKKRKETAQINDRTDCKQKHRLMLTSDSSDSEDYYFKRKGKAQNCLIALQPIEVQPDRLWMHQKQIVKQSSESKEKKSAQQARNTQKQRERQRIKPSIQRKEQGKKVSKKVKLLADLQRQSNFMSVWMQKTNNG